MNEIAEIEQDVLLLRRKLLEKENKLKQLRNALQSSPTCAKLNNNEIYRYSRQMIIPEIGVNGQLKLKKTSFLIVGAGALGTPVLVYLVRAGVEHFGIVDYDTVDANNLHRQILYTESSTGQPKSIICKHVLLDINPNSQIEAFNCQITSKNAIGIIGKYDIILDCSDNVATRYLLNDACVLTGKPLISGSALKLEGQLTVYNFRNGPCYRCLFPKPPHPETVTNCSDGGILGAITGVIGSLQALEAMKIALEFEDILSGRLLIFDGTKSIFRNVKLRSKNVNCAVCSENPIIKELIDYEQFCGMKASDKDFALSILKKTERITVEEYSQIIKNKIPHMLIDVRNSVEYAFCHLDNSKNIPLKEILEDKFLEEISQNVKVIFVCRRGNDSQLAVQHIRSKLNIVSDTNNKIITDIIGGLHDWHKKISNSFPIY